MTYAQPQQQQGPANRLALWINTRKSSPNQPDYKGNVEITYELLQELTAAFNAGQYEQDYYQRPCIKLDVAIYAQQPSADGKKPVMSGRIESLASTQHSASMRAQARQQNGYAQPAPAAPAPQQPAPQPGQPQPQADAQGNWVPSFVAPQAPAPAPAAPAPMPMQQQPAPMPQAPAPVAQPMPGAIHGQPPAQPVAQVPPGF